MRKMILKGPPAAAGFSPRISEAGYGAGVGLPLEASYADNQEPRTQQPRTPQPRTNNSAIP